MAIAFDKFEDFQHWFQEKVAEANRNHETVAATCVTITPEIATWFLNNKDYKNRGLENKGVTRNVNKLLRHMREGKWNELSGEDIQFNEKGVLIDGGNRMNALVKFGHPLRFDLKFGCTQHMYKDSTMCRSYGDNAQIATGVYYDKGYWNAINMVWRMYKAMYHNQDSTKVPHKSLNPEQVQLYYELGRDHINWSNSIIDSHSHDLSLKKSALLRAIVFSTSMLRESLDQDALDAALSLIIQDTSSQTVFEDGSVPFKICRKVHNSLAGTPQSRAKGSTHEGQTELIRQALAAITAVADTRGPLSRAKGADSLNKFMKPYLDTFFNQTRENLTEENAKRIPVYAEPVFEQ